MYSENYLRIINILNNLEITYSVKKDYIEFIWDKHKWRVLRDNTLLSDDRTKLDSIEQLLDLYEIPY